MTALADLLLKLTQELGPFSASAKLDAELIVGHVLGLDRLALVTRSTEQIADNVVTTIGQLVARRRKHEPIAYIIGTKEFWGLNFHVSPDVLIPRPESELLIELALEETNRHQEPLDILDLGTGSGCLAISLAKELSSSGRSCHIIAVDHSAPALRIAAQNAKGHNVIGLVSFVQSNWASAVAPSTKFDVIVSNPPYVRNLEKEEIKKNVLEYEPHLALFVEDNDALLFYRKIAQLAKINLSENGTLYFEINQYLGKETVELLENLGFKNIELKKDIYGNDRMIKCTR